MTDTTTPVATGGALTLALAQHASTLRYEALPDDAVTLARQCILDWIAVTLAARDEVLVTHLLAQMHEQGGHPHATVVGRTDRLPTLAAALVNGAASHALDYDDVNLSMTGHPTVAVLPGLLALAEKCNASGAQLLQAFVAGYETACGLGAHLGSTHYARGFHSTATLGSFGAAAACANLLGLDATKTATALGIAGTQAAGLKSMFGTMCKPLHAGRAAYNGLFAATAAARGFDSRADVVECAQGFAATQSDGLRPVTEVQAPAGGFYLRNNLFKYHAACYLTHAAIECAVRLRPQIGDLSQIETVRVEVDESCDTVCNIVAPSTGLEAKFSLRQTVAFALCGVDTASLDSYGYAGLSQPAVAALRERVRVDLLPDLPHTQATVTITLADGRRLQSFHDAGAPTSDIALQGERIDAKFLSLAVPVLGREQALALRAAVQALDDMPSVHDLTRLFVPSNH